MTVHLRALQLADLPFLTRMHYEAVFWRLGRSKPTYEEGIAYPEVSFAVADWGDRDGDTAVIATIESVPVGAACYRFWHDDSHINGYVDQMTPVLVIGVEREFRHQGIGTQMIEWLIDQASQQAIQQISLSVSKDNHALNLYRQQGFIEFLDKGDAFLMVVRLQP